MLFYYKFWCLLIFCFFFNDTATTEIYTLSLHDALPISKRPPVERALSDSGCDRAQRPHPASARGSPDNEHVRAGQPAFDWHPEREWETSRDTRQSEDPADRKHRNGLCRYTRR